MTKKGLVLDIAQPDILIQTFYFFDKNPNFKGANKIQIEKEPTFRYNFTQSKMDSFPFLGNSAAEAEAESFGNARRTNCWKTPTSWKNMPVSMCR